ncbi:TetR/AcrR family transcriptional regulator [Gordonia sp. ABSL11-1]|uniref:TetR/AcrR family transcriptional regulator n=1 Tax=Gordonia sp. ABSL11-1 TaxID=3053924 RepID=UPI002572CAB0|nr:TetR/AcrR family transcriptional regulator [Gordonia sp. ABSL11-1]MDL9947134.1 TetR/AcrR family transcriptional regulator [Gordonia sp. ABSL11-1]
MTTNQAGWRERKKQATRRALGESALRLACELGPENVRAEDIAEAAGVSPRTYNNYFPSREHAIVAGLTADREARVAARVAVRSPSVRLFDAIVDAVVEIYTDPTEHRRDALLLVATHPELRERFVSSTSAMEYPLEAVIDDRLENRAGGTSRVLAASVAAAVRIALDRWLQPAGDPPSPTGLVAISGALSDGLRESLLPLAPALDAAEGLV